MSTICWLNGMHVSVLIIFISCQTWELVIHIFFIDLTSWYTLRKKRINGKQEKPKSASSCRILWPQYTLHQNASININNSCILSFSKFLPKSLTQQILLYSVKAYTTRSAYPVFSSNCRCSWLSVNCSRSAMTLQPNCSITTQPNFPPRLRTFLMGRVLNSSITPACGKIVCRFGLCRPHANFPKIWSTQSNSSQRSTCILTQPP